MTWGNRQGVFNWALGRLAGWTRWDWAGQFIYSARYKVLLVQRTPGQHITTHSTLNTSHTLSLRIHKRAAVALRANQTGWVPPMSW